MFQEELRHERSLILKEAINILIPYTRTKLRLKNRKSIISGKKIKYLLLESDKIVTNAELESVEC